MGSSKPWILIGTITNSVLYAVQRPHQRRGAAGVGGYYLPCCGAFTYTMDAASALVPTITLDKT